MPVAPNLCCPFGTLTASDIDPPIVTLYSVKKEKCSLSASLSFYIHDLSI